MTRVVERALLDTNVLLAATDEARAHHPRARVTLDAWPAAGTALYTSGQILREYLVVATRPAELNGLGLELSDALANVTALRARMRLLEETKAVADRLATLLVEAPSTGRKIHDANVVATMLVHGLTTLVTSDVSDFSRFAPRVEVIDLATVEA
jgi:predicted nucleic acid-binding protein